MRFDEKTGLTIGLRRRGGQSRGIIGGGRGDEGAARGEGKRQGGGAAGTGSGAGGGVGEQTVVFQVPSGLRGRVRIGSVLLAVNDVPVRDSFPRGASGLVGFSKGPSLE